MASTGTLLPASATIASAKPRQVVGPAPVK
jgi:hypothetical protein